MLHSSVPCPALTASTAKNNEIEGDPGGETQGLHVLLVFEPMTDQFSFVLKEGFFS